MKTLNLAVIGLGYWGPSIVRNLFKIPEIAHIYGCDIRKERLIDLKKNFPNVNITDSYQEILENDLIDAVIIATPISSHFSLAKKAILANKHLLIEKPMTQTSAEARNLITLSKKNNKILMAGHTFVYSEMIKKVKQIMQNKELGDIYYYDSTRINLGLIQKDANVIWDLAPHDFSILNYLFPVKPLLISAFGKSFIGSNHEEVAHIFITFEKGITAHIHVSWLSPVKVRTILIGGSNKMIMINDIEPSEKIRIYNKGVTIPMSNITPFTPAYRSGDVTIPHLEQNEALLNELNHFIFCILHNKQPLTNGESGLAVVKLLEATDTALRTRIEVSIHD